MRENPDSRRTRISFDLIDRLPNTRRYSKERVIRFINYWNANVPRTVIAKRIGFNTTDAVARFASYLRKFGPQNEQYRPSSSNNPKRPELNLSEAGVRTCITCRNEFYSPHKRNLQLCDPCRDRATRACGYFASTLPERAPHTDRCKIS